MPSKPRLKPTPACELATLPSDVRTLLGYLCGQLELDYAEDIADSGRLFDDIARKVRALVQEAEARAEDETLASDELAKAATFAELVAERAGMDPLAFAMLKARFEEGDDQP